MNFGPEILAIFVHDAFTAYNDDILLQVIEFLDALHQTAERKRALRHEDDIGLAVGRAECNVAGMAAHHFHNGNPPMAFSRGADALNPLNRDINRRRISRGHIIDHVVEMEGRTGVFEVIVKTAAILSLPTDVFIGFTAVIQTKVVVDGLGGKHHRKSVGKRLQPVEGAITADADQTFDAQLLKPFFNDVELFLVVRVHIVSRGPQDGPSIGRVEFRDLLEERVERNVGEPLIVETVESLDEADDLQIEFIGAFHSPVNGGVQRGRVSACRQYSDAFHA